MSADVEAWLKSLGTITWGGVGWDITDDKELPEAAAWFEAQLASYEEYLYQTHAVHQPIVLEPQLPSCQAIEQAEWLAAGNPPRQEYPTVFDLPPLKRSHESCLIDRELISDWGPPIVGLPGTSGDRSFFDARNWSRS